MRKCPECKTNNPDSARICNHCRKNLLEKEKKDSRPVVAPGYDFSGTRSVRAFHLDRQAKGGSESIKSKTDIKNAETIKSETTVKPRALFEDRYVMQEKEAEDKNSVMESCSNEKNNAKEEEMQTGLGGFFQRIKSLL